MSELPFVILPFCITVCMRVRTRVPMLCCGSWLLSTFTLLLSIRHWFWTAFSKSSYVSFGLYLFILFLCGTEITIINCKTLLTMWKEFSLIHQDNIYCLHKNFYYIYLFTLSVCVCYSTSLEIRRKHLGVSSLLSPHGARDWTQVSRFGRGPHFYAFHAISIGPI